MRRKLVVGLNEGLNDNENDSDDGQRVAVFGSVDAEDSISCSISFVNLSSFHKLIYAAKAKRKMGSGIAKYVIFIFIHHFYLRRQS